MAFSSARLLVPLLLGAFACETTPAAPASPPPRNPPQATASASTHVPTLAPPASSAAPPAVHTLPVHDIGIYADLDSRVRLAPPAWLSTLSAAAPSATFLTVRGIPVAFAPSGLPPTTRLDDISLSDADRDGIPDQLDILIGAKKAALAAAPYRETYRQIPFPGGDVPRDEGVCTDVIIRALRNAGFDLQKLVHDDAAASPGAYPGIQRLDPNIDHRRVRNLVSWFKRHWTTLPADPKDASDPWLPGDVVFLDTMRDPQPDHLGVVSDTLGPSGYPLIINSWTHGYTTSEMDLLSFVPPTHRFRVPSARIVP